MKKMIAILLTMFMALSLAACGNSANNTRQSDTGNNSVGDMANDNTEPVENNVIDEIDSTESVIDVDTNYTADSAGNEVSAENRNADDMERADDFETHQEVTEISESKGAKVLVVYFSATNTTKGVAKNLADGLGADLYEIVPETPYTDADLDYHDDNSRTTIEMNDPNARPTILGSVENMDQYEVIFLGYPIWWGEAPRIINTFVETYDFNGKTIVPFCTSGGSGMGSSATNLHSATEGATWLDGRRFSGGASIDELVEWAGSLGVL